MLQLTLAIISSQAAASSIH